MSSSSGSTVEHQGCSWSSRRQRGGSGCCARWTGVNIAAMVAGFVFLGPFGLVVLFWILAGRQVQELPGAIRGLWSRMFGHSGESKDTVDNIVFSEYQQTQYDRIKEIKEEIKGRTERFGDFRMDAKRRADKEEFDQFMANSPQSDSVKRSER